MSRLDLKARQLGAFGPDMATLRTPLPLLLFILSPDCEIGLVRSGSHKSSRWLPHTTIHQLPPLQRHKIQEGKTQMIRPFFFFLLCDAAWMDMRKMMVMRQLFFLPKMRRWRGKILNCCFVKTLNGCQSKRRGRRGGIQSVKEGETNCSCMHAKTEKKKSGNPACGEFLQ